MASDQIQCSVLVPTKNRLAHLKNMLHSLESQDVERHSYELIIIDDGSSDGTREYLAGLEDDQFTVLSTPGVGPGVARNFASGIARGEILAFVDDDCIAPGNWLSTICDAMQNDSLAAVAGTLVNADVNNIYSVLYAAMNRYIAATLGPDPQQPWFSPGGNFACRSSMFRDMGGFDSRLRSGGEDREFTARLILGGKRVRWIPSLEVAHSHPFTLFSFLRLFFQRGKASFTLFHIVSKDKHLTVPRMSARGYADMILHIGRGHGAFESAKRVCLTLLAQCFALMGIATSWIRHAASTKPDDAMAYGHPTT